MLARTGNLLVGSWLVLSAFAWPHFRPELENAVVVGILSFAVALVAVAYPPARRWNMLLGAWLVVSSFVLPHRLGTAVHDALLGVAMFALARIPTPGWQPPRTFEDVVREAADAAAHARTS